LVLYCRVIRSVLEYAAQIWSGGLPQMQNNSKTCPENNLSRPWWLYELLLIQSNLPTLEGRWKKAMRFPDRGYVGTVTQTSRTTTK
jgi:hypothetical protein